MGIWEFHEIPVSQLPMHNLVLQTCTAGDGYIVVVRTIMNAPSSVRTFVNTLLITAALNVIQPDRPALSAIHVLGLCPDEPVSIDNNVKHQHQ